MKIAIGSDHAGYPLKEELKDYLTKKGYTVEDCGTNSVQSCDYAVYAKAVCDEVVSGRAQRAILCCGTGVGISIAANKVKGIRAACCSDYFSTKFTRLHNDANVLCMGARVIGAGLAGELADIFLTTEFEGGERHERRIGQITKLENGEELS